MFGLQAWLIIRADYKVEQKLSWQQVHMAVLFSAVYGVFIEGLQATVFVNRSFDTADMLADAIGAVLCYPIVYFRKWVK